MEPADQPIWARARKHAEDKAVSFVHFGIYIAVNAFFGAPRWSTGGLAIDPWFIVPMAA